MGNIAEKSLGKNLNIESNQKIEITAFKVNAKTKHITIWYEIKKLSPNGTELVSEEKTYERFNQPTMYYENGEIITPAVYELDAQGNEVVPQVVITQALISYGTQVRKQANMKWDTLEQSQVGQILKSIFASDLDMIQSPLTVEQDLRQI
mgnify:CR=1 FL=1